MPDQLFHKAMTLYQNGKFQDAIHMFEKIVKKNSSNSIAWNTLGLLQSKVKKYSCAIESMKKSLILDPDNRDYQHQLASIYTLARKNDEALNLLEKLIDHSGNPEKILLQMADLEIQINQIEKAIFHLVHAIKLNHHFVPAYRSLIRILNKTDRSDEASSYIEKLMNLDYATLSKEDKIFIHQTKTLLFLKTQDFTSAEEHLEQLQNLGSDDATTMYCLGITAASFGDLVASKRFFRASYEQDPKNVHVIEWLISMGETIETDKIVNLLGENQHFPDDLAKIHYILGKQYGLDQQYDQSMRHYNQANSLKKSIAKKAFFSAELMQSIQERFDQNFFIHHPCAEQTSNRPIFIVGMPRSGTTLIESTLANHTDIYAAGELNIIEKIARGYANPAFQYPDHIDKDQLNDMAAYYLGAVNKLDTSTRYITDKQPFNSCLLGLIYLLFPHAKIIHCLRDPVDICLSCYFTAFDAKTIPDFHALDTLAEYYKSYHALTQHWQKILPLDIFYVQYEDVVADHAQTTKNLLNFLQLEWQADCLDFNQRANPVTTASVVQTRMKIYKNAVGRWHSYQDHIEPLLALHDLPSLI